MDKDKELFLASGYNKLDIDIAIGGYEEIPQLDPDLMFVKFIMCNEGINANGDTFTKEVLYQAGGTPKYKPIDWEHGQPMIGHITESVYKEDHQGLGYIEATGLIWKFVYPELSSQIKAKASTGDLRLSMECYYKNANYKVGDQIFDQEQAEKLGIVPYVGREYMGKKVARVFNEVIFGGVGVVANPADKKAVFLSVAKDLNALGINDLNDIDQIEDLSRAVSESVKRAVNDFKQKEHSKESNDAVAVAKFVKAFDRAKSSVVAKFNSNTLRTKEQIVAEVRNSVNTLAQEVTSISTAYYRGIASDEMIDLVQETFEKNIALNNEVSEAYLRAVEEDYITYDIIDYSNDSVSTMKASFSVVSDSVVEIDFANATETETKEEAQEMNKEVVATEEELMIEANKKDDKDMQEDLNDGGNDEDTEKKTADETEATLTEDIKENNQDKDKVSTVASEYESKIANLESKLAEANQKVSQLESRFAEIEADKVLASRMSELQGAGIVFSETRLAKEQAKLREMTNEAYADYKELLVEVAGKAQADKGTEEYKNKVLQADDEVDATLVDDINDNDEDEDKVSSVASEEYEVEGISSAKQFNVETPPVSNNRPFGHLSR